MKTILLAIILATLAAAIVSTTGCGHIRMETDAFTYDSWSFFQNKQIPHVELDADGGGMMEGYSNDSSDVAAAVVGAAIQAVR